MPRPKKYKKREKRKYQLSRNETPEDMVIRLFKRGRSINFIVKKVDGLDKEAITNIVKNSSKTRRLWKEEELKTVIKQKSSKVIDLQRDNEKYRVKLRRERDAEVKRRKKVLEEHFDKRLETAVARRIREYDYRVKKHMTTDGSYGDLHFHKTLEYDFLKFGVLAFPYITSKYEITRFELDVLLLLHSLGVFPREQVPTISGHSTFQKLLEEKFISLWRVDRVGKKTYMISSKSETIVEETYKYMTGKHKVPTSKLKSNKSNESVEKLLKKLNKLTS